MVRPVHPVLSVVIDALLLAVNEKDRALYM